MSKRNRQNIQKKKEKRMTALLSEYKLETIVILGFLIVFILFLFVIPENASGKIDTSIGIASAVISFFTWFGVRKILHKKNKAFSDRKIDDTGSVALIVEMDSNIVKNVLDHFNGMENLQGEKYKGEDIRNGSFSNEFNSLYEEYENIPNLSRCDVTDKFGNSEFYEINLLRYKGKGKYIEIKIKEFPLDDAFNLCVRDLYEMIDSLSQQLKDMGISKIHFFYCGANVLSGLFQAEFVNCFEVYSYYWNQNKYLYTYTYNRSMEIDEFLCNK